MGYLIVVIFVGAVGLDQDIEGEAIRKRIAQRGVVLDELHALVVDELECFGVSR